MKNKNGFTLIELLTVMVILGLIMMIVIPTLNKNKLDKDKNKFETYYNITKLSSLEYATTFMNEELGDTNQIGCARFEYSKVQESNIANKFSDPKYICNVVDQITIRNVKGKYDIQFKYECRFKESNHLYNNAKGIFSLGKIDGDKCLPAVKKEEKRLDDELKKITNQVSLNSLFNNTTSKGLAYVNSSVEHLTYVRYSGLLWHIYARDKNDGFRAYLMDPVTLMPFSHKNSKKYVESDILRYLESSFMTKLRKNNKNLTLFEVNNKYTSYIKRISPMIRSDFEIKVKNMMEKESPSKLGIWLDDASVGFVNYTDRFDSRSIYSVIPVVSFNSPSVVVGGSGTIRDPLIIDSNEEWYLNTKLATSNSLRPGDYITINSNYKNKKESQLFRVIDRNADGTKLVSVNSFEKNPYIENTDILQAESEELLESKDIIGFEILNNYKALSNIMSLTTGYLSIEPKIKDIEKVDETCKSNDLLISISDNYQYRKYKRVACYPDFFKVKEEKQKNKIIKTVKTNLVPSLVCNDQFKGEYYIDTECHNLSEASKDYINAVKLGDLFMGPIRSYGGINVHNDNYWTSTNYEYDLKQPYDMLQWAVVNGVAKPYLGQGKMITTTHAYDYEDESIFATKLVIRIKKGMKLLKGKGTRYDPYVLDWSIE